jgi:hypothetical protein
MAQYQYELRQGETVVSTGRLEFSEPPQVGDRIEIAGRVGIVRAIEPLLQERETRLVVQLLNGHQR